MSSAIFSDPTPLHRRQRDATHLPPITPIAALVQILAYDSDRSLQSFENSDSNQSDSDSASVSSSRLGDMSENEEAGLYTGVTLASETSDNISMLEGFVNLTTTVRTRKWVGLQAVDQNCEHDVHGAEVCGDDDTASECYYADHSGDDGEGSIRSFLEIEVDDLIEVMDTAESKTMTNDMDGDTNSDAGGNAGGEINSHIFQGFIRNSACDKFVHGGNELFE
ncbi:hypothetical protein FS749_002117 [Ceratobasidium sp. UAMH 11750]|nr:hypothetical protein FS749_002117 [Ceratobasidium sp. UAMH 11750]